MFKSGEAESCRLAGFSWPSLNRCGKIRVGGGVEFMKFRILLIEDEEEIADFVVRGLAAAMNGSLSF